MHTTVIAKSPIAGRVKSRLCPPCTPTQAAALAAAALIDTVGAINRLLAGHDVRRVLLLDGPVPDWLPASFDVERQSDGDLGERLANGFDLLGPGVIIGMDTPHAVPALRFALDAIDRGQDSLGPAVDGGYWAIGLARPDPAIFAGIGMSTSQTGRDQLERLQQLGRRVAILPEARDIDTFDDVIALAATNWSGRSVQCAQQLVASIMPQERHWHDVGKGAPSR